MYFGTYELTSSVRRTNGTERRIESWEKEVSLERAAGKYSSHNGGILQLI